MRQAFNALAGNQYVGRTERSVFPGASDISSLYRFSENVEPEYYDDQEELIFQETSNIKKLIESLEKTDDEV